MVNRKLRVCIAGATGWAGSALSKGVVGDSSLELVSGVSRSQAGKDLAGILGIGQKGIPIFENVGEALESTPCDVLVEFTQPNVAKANIVAAINKGVNVVVGTSGLTDADYHEMGILLKEKGTSLLAAGNFSITAVLLQKFSLMAAKYIPTFEVVDYASNTKIDTPSGTALQLANQLSGVQAPKEEIPEEDWIGPKESRGAKINSVRVHAVRLPGYTLSVETIFGLKDERLAIRHDAGPSAEPYVQGALLAIKQVGTYKGLRRGLESIMD
ncbi:MAG: 4-hydroxy-tetrahydrodipicolinate reductase [Cyclobacteriaceae bacterium]|nr:4-hydroxy-tetrahydrodipicolinate reductase [Cyclobacteriaceae bacterium]MCB9238545.1 4-hydroxy-tetrahydrodipicolinate reductase [Flammeovirgaceae bacterium]